MRPSTAAERDATDLPQSEAARNVLRSNVLQRYRRMSIAIAASDALSTAAAMLIAYVLRFGFTRVPADFTLLMISAPLALVAIFSGFRLYSVQLISPAEEFRRIIAAVGTTVASIALFGFWSHIPYSRAWLGITWFMTLVLCLSSRRWWHRSMARMRVRGVLAYRTLVVGANDEAAASLVAFRSPTLGFRPVGLVPIDPTVPASMLDPSLIRISTEALTGIGTFRRVLRDLAVDCVFVASSAVTPGMMAQIAKAARLEDVEVRLSVNLPHILPTRLMAQPLDELTIVSLRSAHLSGAQSAAKRALDVTGAMLGLLLTMPLLAGIAVAIRVTSGRPVLFRQVRVGRHGETFTLTKFRTMVRGAEDLLPDLRDRNEADGPMFKMHEDPRVTRIGGWLRRWSLDELPQLVNVLRGEMSLVGPRPSLAEEVRCYEDWQCGRLEVAPGITGLWQVGGRADLLFDEAIRRDIFYIENWSLSYDLYILAKTVPTLLSRRGAY
jgi:exopolysaccharide biosynthesis polyprenyl glycosylphosphotransferase